MNNRHIGQALKNLRISRGWKQTDVADKVGLSRPAISNIESGKRSLTLSTLRRFCEIYNVDISYFGMETENYSEVIDLTSRIESLFNSDLPESEKDDLYRMIMRLYLDSKNVSR